MEHVESRISQPIYTSNRNIMSPILSKAQPTKIGSKVKINQPINLEGQVEIWNTQIPELVLPIVMSRMPSIYSLKTNANQLSLDRPPSTIMHHLPTKGP